MAIVEVRVVTYKRPELLERSLQSLINQTFENWCAYVFDDSPAQEGKSVVESFSDSRIAYKANEFNLGQAGNLNKAFQTRSFADDSEYAFVLEDDNYLYPHFIEVCVKSIKFSGANIVLANQDVKLQEDGQSISLGVTSRGKWFKTGLYEPIETHARLLFCEGISNGGLFWKTADTVSELQVDSIVDDAWQQEILRTIQIREKLYFVSEPLAAWTMFPANKEKRFNERIIGSLNPQLGASKQFILIEMFRRNSHSLIFYASKIVDKDEDYLILEKQLLNMLVLNYSYQFFKGWEKYYFFLTSCIRYLLFSLTEKQKKLSRYFKKMVIIE